MTEQQRYQVLASNPRFELRRYPSHVVAEVSMPGSFERAGNAAFSPLVSYISGRNRAGAKVAMTAPVIQEPATEPGTHVVSFVMPDGSDAEHMPVPVDDQVSVHAVPAQVAAAVVFSGRWTEASYQEHVAALRRDVTKAGLRVTGRPRYARFDPPWKPWFLRRNEVVLPVATP